MHKKMFGGLEQVSKHTSWLAGRLYDELVAMKHTNGRPVCVMYKDAASTYSDAASQGGIVAFNVRAPDGNYFDTALVGNEAMARNIHVRAGSMCNPAGMAHGLGLSDGEVRRIYDMGMRCGQGSNQDGVPLGMVRASFGACSTLEDVRMLVQFLREGFVDRLGEHVEAVSLSRRTKWWVSVTLVHRKPEA
jgi:molybdenum cofactor sulfurtransferase